jgi:hypothetical protein
LADNWLEGPFGWPPRIQTKDWDGEQACTAASVTLGVLGDTGLVMEKFFNNYATTQSTKDSLSWGVIENIPKTYTGVLPPGMNLSVSDAMVLNSTAVVRRDDWVNIFFEFVTVSVVQNFLGISPGNIRLFFTSAPGIPRDILTARNLAKDMLMCDFESVMQCTRHNRRIFVSLVISYLIYLIVSVFMTFVGIPGVSRMFFYAIPLVALWLSYGLSPMCLPMIPTCMLSDVIESIQVVLPAKITWPDALQVYPGCIGPKWYDLNATVQIPPQFANISRFTSACMLPCRDTPFYFDGWESSLAWVVCTLNATTCHTLDIPYFPNFNHRVKQYSLVLSNTNRTDTASVDIGSAYTFCFWMTLAQALPYVVALVAIIGGLLLLLSLPFVLFASGVQVCVQAWSFTHVDM